MVRLGYISFATETGGGYDSSGNPIAASKVWTPFVLCNIATITKEYKLLSEGQYRDAKFKILVENHLTKSYSLTSVKEIHLKDSLNNDLGKFQVQNREQLVLGLKTKFIV